MVLRSQARRAELQREHAERQETIAQLRLKTPSHGQRPAANGGAPAADETLPVRPTSVLGPRPARSSAGPDQG